MTTATQGDLTSPSVAVADGAVVVEPGDTLLILTAVSVEAQSRIVEHLRRALPGVKVEGVYVVDKINAATLIYRPTRVALAPPTCRPDHRFVSGWDCAPSCPHHEPAGITWAGLDSRPPLFPPDASMHGLRGHVRQAYPHVPQASPAADRQRRAFRTMPPGEAERLRTHERLRTQLPKCTAHGDVTCPLCSLNPGSCAAPVDDDDTERNVGCGTYSSTGMHWDTCPNRIATYPEARDRGLIRDPNDSDAWPAHLRDDAPSQRCDACGRSTWDVDRFGKPCRMPLPGEVIRVGAVIRTCAGDFAPPVGVPERVDELPPLGDVHHDPAPDQ